MKWTSTQENLSSGYANKGADQPAHTRSLISTFVIPVLESIMSQLATLQILILQLVSVAEETDFSLALWETLKIGFCRIKAQRTPPV